MLREAAAVKLLQARALEQHGQRAGAQAMLENLVKELTKLETDLEKGSELTDLRAILVERGPAGQREANRKTLRGGQRRPRPARQSVLAALFGPAAPGTAAAQAGLRAGCRRLSARQRQAPGLFQALELAAAQADRQRVRMGLEHQLALGIEGIVQQRRQAVQPAEGHEGAPFAIAENLRDLFGARHLDRRPVRP